MGAATASWTLDLRDAARPHAPEVPALPHLYDAAAVTWKARMRNEYGSAQVFEALALQLRAAGFDDATVVQCGSFAHEERNHGVLCGAVVEALGGTAVAEMPAPVPVPAHEDASSAVEAALRNVLSICCLSETVAVSLIGAERLEMPEGALRDLLGRILADEIGHARFGWRLLARVAPTLDDTEREALGRYLAVAFAHLEQHELSHLPAAARPPAEGVGLGLCSGPDARVLFYETVEQVIVPNLEAHGLPARSAWLGRPRA